jgi:hyperosmotically inducible protein
MAIDPRERSIPARDGAPVDAVRADAARADAARADAARAEAARIEAARAESARVQAARAEAAREDLHRRATPQYQPRRRRWPGVLAAALIGAAIAGVMVSNYYSDRTIGQRLDSVVDKAEQGVQVPGSLARTVDDATITASVKTALAADPALSALRIDVTTRDGVVTLEGPAPNAQARERAQVLAAAPEGVVRVDNRLVVEGAGG